MTANPPSEKPVQQQVVKAARERFLTFGYGKTTMAEIASDTGMSAANLYRHFENKQDIGAACAEVCICEMLAALEEIVSNSSGNVQTRLESLVLAMLAETQQAVRENPSVNQIVDIVVLKQPAILFRKFAAEQALIASVLQEGCDKNEIRLKDVQTTAKTVHAATAIFRLPAAANMYSLEVFEQQAQQLVELLMQGMHPSGPDNG